MCFPRPGSDLGADRPDGGRVDGQSIHGRVVIDSELGRDPDPGGKPENALALSRRQNFRVAGEEPVCPHGLDPGHDERAPYFGGWPDRPLPKLQEDLAHLDLSTTRF
jgi:hypothetical protein